MQNAKGGSLVFFWGCKGQQLAKKKEKKTRPSSNGDKGGHVGRARKKIVENKQFGTPQVEGLLTGFTILMEKVPRQQF